VKNKYKRKTLQQVGEELEKKEVEGKKIRQ